MINCLTAPRRGDLPKRTLAVSKAAWPLVLRVRLESTIGAESPPAASLQRRPWLWLIVPFLYFGLVLLRLTVLVPNSTDSVSAIWPTSAILATGLLLMPR